MGLTLEQKFGMHEKSELEEIEKKKKKKITQNKTKRKKTENRELIF